MRRDFANREFTFAVQSSSSSKWMSPPKSPVEQSCCFCSKSSVVTKLVGEISMCERVPGTVKRIAGKIVSCGASFITCLRGGISQTRLLCQPHGSRQPGRTSGWCKGSRIGKLGPARPSQTPCSPTCASRLPGWNWFVNSWGISIQLTCKSMFFSSIPWNLSHT